MNIQEFQTDEKKKSKDPNIETLSKLIDECDQQDDDIRNGLGEYNDKMQRYRME